MADLDFEYDVLRDLLEEAAVIGRLAATEKPFIAAYEAFRAEDREKFQATLTRLELIPYCQLVCEWMRIKECVLLCLELCGPPQPADKAPGPRTLAEAIVRITAEEKYVQQLVDILAKRDRAAFQRFVKRYELGPICHLFCHWVCYVRYRLVCRWVCGLEQTERPNLVAELMKAGAALRALLENGKAFDQAAAAAQKGDAEKVRAVIEGAGLFRFCEYICFFFCSWRCVLLCLRLCRQFPPAPVENEPAEAYAFAQATAALAAKPTELEQLSAAVGAGDLKTYARLIGELQLQRYCVQLCHWLCFLRCRRFCILICPPVGLMPEFTSIGGYDYLTDINSTVPGNGLTVGTNYAFTDLTEVEKPVASLRLNGVLPEKLFGIPMEYRFEFQTTDDHGNPTSAWQSVVPAQIAPTLIGHWQPIIGPTKRYWVNHPAPPPGDLVVAVAPDGWIKVPQDSIFGNFSQNGNLINLISSALTAFPSKDETGVVTGNAPNHPLVLDKHFGLRMRARKQGDLSDGIDAGTCHHVAIDNTFYDNVKPHPAWDGGAAFPPGQRAVRMVNIEELGSTGCQKITNSLTVLFTAAHPNLGSAAISMTGGGGTHTFDLPPTTLPPAGPGEWYGTATPHGGWTVNDLEPCAYLVTLEITVLLTDGDTNLTPLYDQIAFCKAP